MLDKIVIVYILVWHGIENVPLSRSRKKETYMFEVTEKAGEVIRKLLEGKDPQSVRIMMTEGG